MRHRRPVRPRSVTSVNMDMGSRTRSKSRNFVQHFNSAVYKKQTVIAVSVVMALVLAVAIFSCIFFGHSHRSSGAEAQSTGMDGDVQVYGFDKVAEYPHDPHAFTQGLLHYKDDTLYESTGMRGQSSLRQVDLTTGKVLRLRSLSSYYFGEGLTLWNDRLLQVFWQTNVGFSYDMRNFSQFTTFRHPMKDGWGLATDGEHVIGSDGTSTLYFMDPTTFAATRSITVKDGGQEVRNLNEIEYIKGEIWANIWLTNCIVRVSPQDGRVKGWILLPELRDALTAAGNNNIDVLNGIAWDSKRDRIFVTGKYWPKIYEIKLRSAPENFDISVARQLCILR